MRFQRHRIFAWLKRHRDPRIDLSVSGMPNIYNPGKLFPEGFKPDLYGPNLGGYPPLKEALAARFGVPMDHIAITAGATQANFTLMAALSDYGKPCIAVESPAYEPFVVLAETVTGVPPVRLQRRFEADCRLSGDEARSLPPDVKLLVLSNLHNPSGVAASLEVVGALAGEMASRDGWLLVDEVFYPFWNDVSPSGGKKLTSATTHPRIIATGSLTKVFGLGGLRAGWVFAEPEVIEQVERVVENVNVIHPFAMEWTASRVVADDGLWNRLLDKARSTAREHLRLTLDWLRNFPQLVPIVPDGGISIILRFRDGRKSFTFCERLIDRFGVLVMPGDFFDIPDGFRVSYGCSNADLTTGLKLLAEALNQS